MALTGPLCLRSGVKNDVMTIVLLQGLLNRLGIIEDLTDLLEGAALITC